ncbi:MAG: flagellar export chaperone FliS [Planctomycetes bacterium]|nr:flagellar export chaperone FliS [Planctomycetota bacterium]MCB9909961.1 flagellar export chaperone FliS [Planctomycetota bacterium]MCB9912902.1 flagellar export chaperone FliS [Planctomycetota bacterium]HPF13668.1 flagellar export chaperone FliS [Planctomycetota bacterium]
MNAHEASQAYFQATVENAPPLQIIRLLYQGALRYLGQAMNLPEGATGAKFLELCRNVEDIVIELRLALDHGSEGNPEIPRNLERLYLFCEDELLRAQMEKSIEALENVKHVLEILLDAWRKVELESESGR